MARGNKFATFLHRNTNKMVVILVYAVLEWFLIFLLLLNSLFSYLITKFAKFVGLQPPCLWCSRIDLDHVLQQGNNNSHFHKDLICEAHASEISSLGYCSNHKKLAETKSMCEDCLASRPNHHENLNSFGMRHRIGFISWVSHEENEENVNKCSCCNERLSSTSQLYSPYLLLKPSWGDENYTSKGSLIVEEAIDDEKEDGDKEDHHILSDIESFILREAAEDRSSSVSNLHSDEKDAEKDEKEDYLVITELDPSDHDSFIRRFSDSSASIWEDRSLEVLNFHFEDCVACDSTNRLIPVKLIDSVTSLDFESCELDEDLREMKQRTQNFASESPIEAESSVLQEAALLTMDENAEKTSIGELENLENFVTLEVEELKQNSEVEVQPQGITTEDAQTSLNDDDNSVEAPKEEPDNSQVDLPQSHEPICSTECMQEDESSSSDDDAEVHNAFDKFIAQNNLSQSESLANDDRNAEADIEEPDITPPANLLPSKEPDCSCQCISEDESSSSDDDAEVQSAFDKFIAQNNLSQSQGLSKDDTSIEASMEEPENTPRDNACSSEEPACSSQCIPEDQSSTSEDDTEAPNAFDDEFIAQNNLCLDKTSANDKEYAEMIEKTLSVAKNHEKTSQCIPEDQSSTSEDDDTEATNAFDEFISQNNLCPDKTGPNDKHNADEMIEKTLSVEENHEETSHQSSKCSESYEVEEEKLPETPSSIDGLHYLHRKLMLEKRESGTEDSGDGSVASEVDYGDPVLTVDRLKTALKAKRRALSAIYQELEEERSASAVAANQTMAMITRLQEEKAAMQMEALQYQRMMEEQSEYDQEALQLLNELMIKREKEKQELENELEEYRQKVMEYEAKEKLRLLRRMKDGSVRSRDSSSDELSIDLNCEAREEDKDNGFFNHEETNHNDASSNTVSNLEEMALDCVKHVSVLDNTLAEFEEERASILDQLKALEEKIISLGDTEEFLDEIKLIENSSTYGDNNDLNENCNFNSNEFSDDKSSLTTTYGSLAKRLLPFLDAAENETEETYAFDTQLEPEESVEMQNSVPICEMDSMMKVSIEEEVDRVYERLQSLETDREFLQHCMGSLQNGGEKGVDLLQEILQHLRDLKEVELRLKSLGNDPL